MMKNFVFTVEKVKSEEVPHIYLVMADGPHHFRNLLKSVKGSIQSVSSFSGEFNLMVPKDVKGKKNIYQVLINNQGMRETLVIADSIEKVIDQVLDFADHHKGFGSLESIELHTEGVEVLM